MQISDAIERVLTAHTPAELIDAAAVAASDVVACDGVRIAEGRMGSSVAYRVMARYGPALDPSPSIARSPLSSPLVAEYARSRFQCWLSMHDVVPGRAWNTHPFYLEVYRPLGLSAQITCSLRDTGKQMYSLSLNRAGRDFDESERERLRQFRRLVRSAWLRVAELEAVRSALASLRDGREDDAMVVLTPDPIAPGIAYCTEAMRNLLRQKTELWEVILRTAAAADHVGARIGTSVNSTLRINAVHTGDAVVVRAVPASVAILTEREKEILAALADGHTAHAIAHRLTISERTVHKHLEHLYAKIGVHDRLEAVALARRAGIS